ncbi:MAG: dihydropteroate synthase [Rikenellaceae bacterium]
MARVDFREPQVMAIVNVTPDSFYSSSRTFEAESLRERVEQAVTQGASILDIGGYSSRPGADDISMEQEWERVEMGLRAVQSVGADVAISIDTFRVEVARRAYEMVGEVIVNDISGGCDQMYRFVGENSLPYILMHMRGTPQNMQSLAEYDDVTQSVKEYFEERIERLRSFGVEQIILDPGFGFAKSVEDNYTLMGSLSQICSMGYPLLSGVSRKSMIYKVLSTTPEESLTGTIALNWESLRQGATILRVHDVREASEVVKLFSFYQKI